MKIAADADLEWCSFGELSAARLYELLRFRQAIFVVEQASPYADLDGRDRDAWHLLLSEDGLLAGCLRLIPAPDGASVAIGRVAVAPRHRGRGLARHMMSAALARCRRDFPGRPVRVSAQTYLRGFYAGLGFVEVSAPYDDCGVPHVDMERAGELHPAMANALPRHGTGA